MNLPPEIEKRMNELVEEWDIPNDPDIRFPSIYKDGFHAGFAASNERTSKLVEALRFYAECRHYKAEKVYGEIIEYDVDAGPLRDTYEEVLPTEERGRTAKQALEEWEGGE